MCIELKLNCSRVMYIYVPFQKVESATQEAASNAVAQLQTNQQDPSIPMRVSSSAEMLTAQDVLSFEMLKISENNQAETEMESEVATLTHQTTPTPHNTPLGMYQRYAFLLGLDSVVCKIFIHVSDKLVLTVSFLWLTRLRREYYYFFFLVPRVGLFSVKNQKRFLAINPNSPDNKGSCWIFIVQ